MGAGGEKPRQSTSLLEYRRHRYKQRDADVYSRLPEIYTEYVHRVGYFIVDEICDLAGLEPGQRVLDVGSGTGMATAQVAEFVAPEGFVLGIDHSEGLVEHARRGAPRGLPVESLPVEFQVMDAESLELQDEEFDVVISFSSIMQFPNPDRAVAEMFRVLKPGGLLVLSYTAVRPIARLELARYLLRRLMERVLSPIQPMLSAPNSLIAVAAGYLPELEEPAEPTWSAKKPRRRILNEIAAAGFEKPERIVWCGRDIHFSWPEDFYEAQLMICSDLRVRSSAAPPEQKAALREHYLGLADQVLRRGGKLIYPFGAVVIRTRKPD